MPYQNFHLGFVFLGQQKRNYGGNRHDPQKGINDQPALAKTDRQEIPHCETLLFLVRVSVQCSFDHCFDLTPVRNGYRTPGFAYRPSDEVGMNLPIFDIVFFGT